MKFNKNFNELYLPSKDLLSRRSCRISLRVQGDDDVGAELFSLKNLLRNLFCDFGWDLVMALHLEEKVKDNIQQQLTTNNDKRQMQMIIWRGRHLGNDHPDGPASRK